MLPLTGDMKTELKYRRQKIDKFYNDLYNSPLSNHETHIAYQTRYKAIVCYPYTVTPFKSSELEEMQKGGMRLILPKMGINRNMPRSVIYGPRILGGRQMMDQRIEQPTINYKTTLGHMRRDDNISQALITTMRDVQIEIGTSTPFYTLDPTKYSYGTDNTRWQYTWHMTKEFHLNMEIPDIWLPITTYPNDKCKMEVSVQDRYYQGKNAYKLVTINQCRLYQQSFYISDLVQQDEKTVNKDYLDGTSQHINNEVSFPTMYKPTLLQWNEWKAFIFRNFLSIGSL